MKFSLFKKVIVRKKNLTKCITTLMLALSMVLSLFTMTACSAEGLEDALDIAIDVLDALETEEGGGNSSNQTQKPNNSSQNNGNSDQLTDDKWDDPTIEEDGWYSTKDEVALYIHIYGELPDNFITKNEAYDLGWDSDKGNLWKVADGMSIGGDKFSNREGLLPKAKGRQYYECDINYNGGYRGAERIVYSNDGLIYYTNDHYESFTCLYGEE